MHIGGGVHLTYCTNVHPAERWSDVRGLLAREVAAVKRAVSPGAPLGLGLRLSGEAAGALGSAGELEALSALLDEGGLYLFTLNGFPHGAFHGAAVKEAVYRPDWREEARLAYTERLASILAALLPDDQPYGSVSTVPGAFRSRAAGEEARAHIADTLLRCAASLVSLERRTGRRIVLALEPEPHCLLETAADAVAFFEAHLLGGAARARLGELAGVAPERAEALVRRHLGVCLDACHEAVAFSSPGAAAARLRGAGITVAKVQLSAGLRLPAAGPLGLAALEPFAEDTYLHQVVARGPGGVRRHVDLPEALAAGGDPDEEWRIHFHIPLYAAPAPPLAGTRGFLEELLALQRADPLSAHLEVETYTFGVLPPGLRPADAVEGVVEELRWARERLLG